MAYNTKYSFRFVNCNGAEYIIYLEEDGFSGTAKQRPLGKAPVLRMQENGPFRSTSLDLVLECREEGEFVSLYTTDPRQYRVSLWRRYASSSNVLLWRGYVATEIYSEPDIAPPYDVKITATDGLGVLKEYDYETGTRTVANHLVYLLGQTGLDLDLWTVSSLKAYGSTVPDFFDNTQLNLDYLAGKNCYEVFSEFLTSLRLVVTQWHGSWLVLRETDISVASNGNVSGWDINGTTGSLTITGLSAVVGQMGASGTQMWPVGYLTRRVVPAKKSVTLTAPWHWRNGFPSVSSNGWTLGGAVSYNSTYKVYRYLAPTQSTAQGYAGHSMILAQFATGFKVKVRASVYSPYTANTAHTVQVKVTWMVGSTTYFYAPSTGWTTTSNNYSISKDVTNSNPDYDPNEAEEITFEIPSMLDSNSGIFSVSIRGMYIDVYDIQVIPDTVTGYKDIITIDNGARGTAPSIELAVCRALSSNFIRLEFMYGIFWKTTSSGGSTTDSPVFAFSDANNTNKDFMSLTALSYAKEYAAPRIEISGTIDVPTARNYQPLLIKSHGVWALLSSYDWDLYNANISFKATTLPTATLTVDSEDIISY